jgi:hypothetical protein
MNPTVIDIINAFEDNDMTRLQIIFDALDTDTRPTYYDPDDEYEWDRNVEFGVIYRER